MSEGRLTTPRCFGAGWDTGREQSHAPPARRRRVPRPAPEVALVPHGPRRSCGEPTPRRLRGTRGPRADAGPTSQAVARPAPSAGGRAGPAVPASAASCVASVAARRPSARFLRGVHAPGGPRAACAPLARRLAESWRGGNWGLHGLLANSFQMDAMGGHCLMRQKKINSAKINKQPALKAHAEDNRVGVGDPRVWRTRKTYSNAKEVLASNEKT